MSDRLRIVLLGRMASWCEPELRKRLDCDYSLVAIPDPRDAGRHAAEIEAAEVLVGSPLGGTTGPRSPHLKLLHMTGAGLDGLDFNALPPDTRVCNTFHHEIAMAEYVIMAMLCLARQPQRYDAKLRQGNWDGSCIWGETPVLEELYGQTLLLIGLGHIANEIAVRARAFGMWVTGVSRNPGSVARRELYDDIASWEQWRNQLPHADWVAPCCPLTPETEGMFDGYAISKMKPSARIINISRGRVIEERALYEALKNREIAGAALDVWYRYPASPDETCLPSRFPFHDLDNVLLSPHISAWTQRTILGRAKEIAQNINRLSRGEPLANVVR
ncbi:MAG: 2-hydroxyacid dehydrogenase [Bryobacteraceae bacterium]